MTFNSKVQALIAEIKKWLKIYEKAKKHVDINAHIKKEQLNSLLQELTIINVNTEYSDCIIERYNQFRNPKDGISNFMNFTVIVQLKLKAKCELKKGVEVTYPNGEKVIGAFVEINELRDDLIDVSFDISFQDRLENHNQNVASAIVTFLDDKNGFTLNVGYEFLEELDISDVNITKSLKKKYLNRAKYLWIKNKNIKEENFDSWCPNVELKSSRGQYYISISNLNEELDRSLIWEDISGDSPLFKNPDSLSKKKLLELNEKCFQFNNFISFQFVKNARLELMTLKSIESSYIENDKHDIFNAEYQKNIGQLKEGLVALTRKQQIVSKATRQILLLQEQASIPQVLLDKAEMLFSFKENQTNELNNWQDKFKNLDDISLDFKLVKLWTNECTQYCLNVPVLWEKERESFRVLQETEEQKIDVENNYYKQWKEKEEKKYIGVEEKNKEAVDEILKLLKKYKDAIERTDYDGVIEYEEGEDIVSKEEKRTFKTAKSIDVVIQNQGGELDDGDKSMDDIQQGQLGDCYLLSALISISNGETKGLLDNIVQYNEEKNLFVVKLHENGVPINVEVDGALMYNQFDPNKYKSEYINIGANTQSGLWVAVIEKAYAKFLKEGEYTEIVSGNTKVALSVLLGNKAKTPSTLLLNANNKISKQQDEEKEGDTIINNPIKFDNAVITVSLLRALIPSVLEENYKISLSSPDNHDGLSNLGDDTLVMLDKRQFMTLDHDYSIIAATDTNITMRNPHGDHTKEYKLFNKELKENVNKLFNIIDTLQGSEDNKISDRNKGELDQIVITVKNYPAFSDIVKLWKKLLDSNKLIQDGNEWRIDKKASFNRLFTAIDKIKGNKELTKGMLKAVVSVQAVQVVSYNTLINNFSELLLTKIK